MDNRYIDPETGKIKDSKRNEIVGGAIGGLAGTLGINALNATRGYKQELTDVEEYKQTLPNINQDINDLEFASEDLGRLHALRNDPSVLDSLPETEREYYRKLNEAAGRIEERGKWNNFHEHPLEDRLRMLINGKPSLDGLDPAVVDNVQNMFGNQPFDPNVSHELAEQLNDLKHTRQLVGEAAERTPQFPVKQLLPSLDHYRPKNLMQTLRNPMVMGGAMLGVGAGAFADEYRKHLHNIEVRNAEAALQKQAATKIPPLPLPKPAKPKALIPKKVKRIGMLAGGAGILGYTGYNATKDFAEGTKLTPAATDEGMNNKMAKVQNEKYDELHKEAFSLGGIGAKADDAVKQIGTSFKSGAANLKGTLNGQNLKGAKSALRMGENMKAPREATSLLKKNVAKEKTKRVGAIGGLAAAGAGALTYGGVQTARKLESQEKTAADKYEELLKVAYGEGFEMNRSYSGEPGLNMPAYNPEAGPKPIVMNNAPVQKPLGVEGDVAYRSKQTHTAHPETRQRLGEVAAPHADNRVLMHELEGASHKANPSVLKRLGVGAGAAAGLGAAAYGGVQLAQHLRQEKTASEKYMELSKIAFDGGSDDYWQSYADEANRGLGQRMVDGAHEMGVNVAEGARNIDPVLLKRLGIGAGAVAGAGATTYGGIQLANHLQQEKTASEKYLELSKAAFDGGSDDYWQSYADEANRGVGQRMVDGAHEMGVNAAEGIRNINPAILKRLGIGAGAAAGAGAATYGGVQLANHLQQEKTAAEEDKRPGVGKAVGIGAGVGLGAGAVGGAALGHLATSDKVINKARNNMIDRLSGQSAEVLSDAVLGFDEGAEVLQGNKKLVKGVAAGALGAKGALVGGGLGLIGGLAAKRKYDQTQGTEKVAKEMTQEKSQYALEHPIAKSVKDGAKWGAVAGLPAFGIGAIPGAAIGSLAGLEHGLSRAQAGKSLAKGDEAVLSPTAAGALTGAGISGAVNAPYAMRRAAHGDPLGAAIGLALPTALAGGVGALIGRNQEKHFNNAQGNGFQTNAENALKEKMNEKNAGELDDSIEKVAAEAINELFKEASAAIDTPMEKVAGYEDPIHKITFGYDKL